MNYKIKLNKINKQTLILKNKFNFSIYNTYEEII